MTKSALLDSSPKDKATSMLLIISCVSIGYAFFGFVGDFLTTQASDAAAIWPASGIALAACLIWGRGVWPGIFIGAFVINAWIGFDGSSFQSILHSILLVSTISLGAVLQALTGYYFITRITGPQPLFQSNKEICQLICWGGVISCFISSSIGVSSLVFAGFIPLQQYLSNWFIWWLGDAIGIIIFTPLTLVLFASPREHWQSRISSVAAPLLVALVLVIAVFSYASLQEQRQQTLQFESYVSNLSNALKTNLNQHQENLEVLAGFFEQSEHVSRIEFKNFTKRILAQQNDIQALVWIPTVTEAERQQFELGIKNEGINDFAIFDKSNSRDAVPQHKIYSVINYIEPYKDNKKVLGLNVLSDHKVAEILLKSQATGDTVISSGMKLVLYPTKQLGVVMYHPVYKDGHWLDVSEKKNVSPVGFVASVFYVKNLIKASLIGIDNRNIVVELYEQLNNAQLQFLYSNKTEQDSKSDSNAKGQINYQQTLMIADKQWVIHFASNYGSQKKSWSTWLVLSGGLIFTAMFSGFLMALSGRNNVIKQAVEDRTKDLAQVNYVLTKANNALASTNKKLQDSEFQFRKLVQTQSAIVWRYDLDEECFTFVSDEAESLLGYSNEQWFEPHFWVNHIHPDDREQALKYTLQAVEKYQKYDFEYRMITLSGNVVWVKDIVNVVSNNGVISELVGVMIDISTEHIAEEQTRLAATTFETLEGITITDKYGVVLKVNHAFTVITGYSEEESVGRHMSFLKSGRQDQAFYSDLWKQLIETGKFEGEIWNRKKNGDVFPEWITITAVKDKSSSVTHYVGIFSDITAKKASEDEIRSLAFYDPLTNLPNRRLLLDRVQQEILEAKRNHQSGAVIFLDLDRFKILNDSLGHHIGDELLIQVSERLQSILREEDTASRLGGDEFVILLPAQGETAEEAADKAIYVAERIRILLNKPYSLEKSEHTFSCSLGISIFPEDSEQASSILQQADTAMYLSKERGKNCISFYHSSMQKLADKRLVLENELRHAVNNQQLVLLYQPQVDEFGQIISVEALVRWRHPDKGMVSPADFIPVAEETSLILPVGHWVLNEACRQIKIWSLAEVDLKHVAINVSPRQFKQQDFVNEVNAAIQNHEISADQLTIELTESIVAEDIQDTVQKMNALKSLGIKISIDDFGTGYSSLSYLKQLPLDQLKIDQSFVKDININLDDTVIVETIINMANNLGLNVIAEGVETVEQAQFLKDKGCKNFQGYFYGRPQTAMELKANICSADNKP